MFGSPHDDVEIPDLSVFDYLFAEWNPAEVDRPALIDGTSGKTTSYGTLRDIIEQVATGLSRRGIAQGDTVALLAPNGPAFVHAFHGILRAGATATTINVLYTAEDIADQIEQSSASLLITVSPLVPQARAGLLEAGLGQDQLIVLDGAEGYDSLQDLLGESEPPRLSITPATHLAVLPFSSGTTGRAKGVMLTHRNLVANVAQCRDLMGVTAEDSVIAILPFFHIYGMTVLLNIALKARASLVTLPRFDLEQFLSTIQEQRCTYVFIAPPVAVALAKHPLVEQYDLSSVKVVLSGAAPLDAHTAASVAERLGCRVVQGYGMTEMSPVSHVNSPVADEPAPWGSVGTAIPNVECKLIDPETGDEIPFPDSGESAPGELLCRGPMVMTGYLGRPEATAETLDDEGFLHTGDIATVDAAGCVSIVDRVKELIKYKGYQVAPAELEAVLLEHPQIADAAVIPARDESGEEVPKAFVVMREGAEVADEAIMGFVAERVAPHKKVRLLERIDVVPKSASGKILRKDLRAREHD